MERTAEDVDYLFAHDATLAAIRDKANASPGSLTAAEIDYQQKAGGFLNTMAALSPAEKRLYDDMVASGNQEAAAGLTQVAFIRATMGHMAGGENGTTYDPSATELSAANVLKYFRHSIVDNSGKAESQFQALVHYLENRPAQSTVAAA